MGSGHLYGAKSDVQYVQCRTCHGTPTSEPGTALIQEPNELAVRQARLAGHADFLAVGDRVVQSDRGELLWSVKQVSTGRFVQVDKVEGKIYKVPMVKGSRCTQDGSSQAAAYCHECHSVAR